MDVLNKVLPGIFFCFILAVPAWILGKVFPMIGGPVFGILIGIVTATLFRIYLSKNNFQLGVSYTSKKMLQYAIILLGFNLNIYTILTIGGQSLYIIFFTILAAFITAFIVGKLLKLDITKTVLIGIGTAICGASAIAATAPIIRAKNEDIVHAVTTIFLFNIIAVFIFPPLGHLLQLSNTGFGIWAGTAINDTSSVVAAATVWSATAGSTTALDVATVVKLTRALMIIPITLIIALVIAYLHKRSSTDKQAFHFTKIFPWFILWFILASVLVTFFPLPVTITTGLVTAGTFLIIMAMTAIGLQTNLSSLATNGSKPILIGFFCWVAVASVSLLVQMNLNLW